MSHSELTASSANDATVADQANPDSMDGGNDSAPSPIWRWFWLGLGLTVLPLLLPYFINLWESDQYRFFPFAIAATAWLAYTRSDGRFYPPRGWLSWATIVFALLLVVAGIVLKFPWFASVAFVLIAGTLLFALRGIYDKTLFVLVLPLLTVVQLIRLDQLLVQYLQRVTTWLSSVFLDGFAIPHAISNNVVQLADRELFVAEACSGIQSVFTLSFLALLLIAWRRRRVWMSPIYVAIACFLAIFANVIRVTTVALAETWYQADLAQGWPHDLLGYLALAIAGGFLLSFDHLIATLLHQVPVETEENPLVSLWNLCALRPQVEQGVTRVTQQDLLDLATRDQSNRAVQWAQSLVENRIAQGAFVSIACLLTAGSLAQVLLSEKPADLIRSDKALVFDPPKDVLADSFENLTIVNHTVNRGFENPRLGANSDIWECEWDDVKAQLVLSQPHNGWHELCDCYERLQWKLLDRDIRSPDDFESLDLAQADSDSLNAPYIVARFKRSTRQYGYLLFAGIGSDGSFVDAPDSLSAFTHRVWNRIDRTGVWKQNEVIMLQMWVTSMGKLKPKQLHNLEKEFIAARSRFASEITLNVKRSQGPVDANAQYQPEKHQPENSVRTASLPPQSNGQTAQGDE